VNECSVQVYKVQAVSVCVQVYKVRIRHDNSMLSPAWFLDKVEVVDTMENVTYEFHCERWLAKNKDDCKIERSLYVKVSTSYSVRVQYLSATYHGLATLITQCWPF
jgi:hypothetical protein